MKNHFLYSSGLSLIATVLLLMIFSLFMAVAVSLVTTGSNIAVQEEQGVQALFIADGGLHYTLAKNKTNVPNYSTYSALIPLGWIPLGGGEFKVDTPTYLTADVAADATVINVVSTAQFPLSGRLAIGDSFDLTYTGKNLNQFNGLPSSPPPHSSHTMYDSVYPAARFSGLPPGNLPLPNNCNPLPTIPVDEDPGGFQIPGIIFIDTEYFYCTGAGPAPPPATNFQFTNCTRCYLGSSSAAHPVGRFASQYILTSTGRIANIISSNVQRVVRISVGPRED